MPNSYIIAGTGFRGFCDTLAILEAQPDAKITLLEAAPFFGGVMHSLEIDGFAVDKGVHVFDSIPAALAEIVNDIMMGETTEVDFVSASAFNGVVTDGFSLPDLSSLDKETQNKITSELKKLAKSQPANAVNRTLRDLFNNRYGKTASNIFCDIFFKVYHISADEVEPTAIAQTSMGRLKHLADEEMLKLKEDAFLDTVLAARRKSMGKIDDLVSIYPSDGRAMLGWCLRTVEWLRAKGVQIELATKIENIQDTPSGVKVVTNKGHFVADKLIWANDNVKGLAAALDLENTVDGYQHGTPMIFVTLMLEASRIRDFTYLQNFDPEGLTYRSAAAGLFSHQIREDGTSFVTCECPAETNGELWNDHDKMLKGVWQECKDLGVVSANAQLRGSNIINIPETFKLAKLDYQKRVNDFTAKIPLRSENVILRNVVPFFRRDIFFDSKKLPALLGI